MKLDPIANLIEAVDELLCRIRVDKIDENSESFINASLALTHLVETRALPSAPPAIDKE